MSQQPPSQQPGGPPNNPFAGGPGMPGPIPGTIPPAVIPPQQPLPGQPGGPPSSQPAAHVNPAFFPVGQPSQVSIYTRGCHL